MDDRQCARRRNQATIRRPRKRRDCAFNLTCLPRVDCDQFQSERRRGSLDCAELASSASNVTGFVSFEYGLSAKWLELLKEIAPRVTRVAEMPTVLADMRRN